MDSKPGDNRDNMQPETNFQKNRHLFDRWAKSYDNAVFQFWMKKFHAPARKSGISIMVNITQ